MNVLAALAIILLSLWFVWWAYSKSRDRAPQPQYAIPVSQSGGMIGSLFALFVGLCFAALLLFAIVAFIHFAWRAA